MLLDGFVAAVPVVLVPVPVPVPHLSASVISRLQAAKSGWLVLVLVLVLEGVVVLPPPETSSIGGGMRSSSSLGEATATAVVVKSFRLSKE